MTEEQMEKLAEIIFQKLLTKQSEFDKQFIEQLESAKNINPQDFMYYTTDTTQPVEEQKSDREVLTEELERLNKLLSRYVEQENYESAAVIKNKISKINKKLDEI